MLIEKEEKINQARAAWLTACQGVFCRGVKNSAIALPCPPLSLLLFPPPPSFSSITCLLTHHHTVASFLNVSPNSPNISLTFHSIVPPLPPRTLPFPPLADFLAASHPRRIHCQTFRATEWHSFNLVVVQPSEEVKKTQTREWRYTPVTFKTTSTHPLYRDLLIIQLRRRFLFALRYLFSLGTWREGRGGNGSNPSGRRRGDRETRTAPAHSWQHVHKVILQCPREFHWFICFPKGSVFTFNHL